MNKLSILLVEDDEIDVMSFRRGMRKYGNDCPLVVAAHGEEALRILRGSHPDKSIEPPMLIFIDVNMPVMSGAEFLRELRGDPAFAATVVFMLSTSDHPVDRRAAYEQHIAGYILKQDLGDSCQNLHELIALYRRIMLLP
ncbi:response regulator [Crateriforma conspicua]|uniref:response regulator n=1 Tax=Crateriforma conspicua TaxID=2527996 RepID=UPI001188A6AD|nr:response regulator [Crateriforma conspicua]QDV64113.1 Response regulator rcp1 [Crateriforma conspicua]